MLLDGAFTALLLFMISGASARIDEVDFPPVDLNLKDSAVALSFRHPSLFYRDLVQSHKTFHFTVSSHVGDFEGFCTARNDNCTLLVSFPAGEEKCVRLKRSTFDGVTFRQTGRICLSVVRPQNVTLSCRNLNVSVSWTFSKHPARFRVHVAGSAGHQVSETAERRFDLSRFLWASEQRYLGFHYVIVTATDGGNQSESVRSKTFSFNGLKLADIKCELDFPPVDLQDHDSAATLTFMNPLHFYRELNQADRRESSVFRFRSLSSDVGDFEGSCRAEQEKCKCDVMFPEAAEKCVNLTGWLSSGNNVGNIPFRKTGRICAAKSSQFPAVTLAILLFLVLVLVAGSIVLICKVKAWTMTTSSDKLPHSLAIKPQDDCEYDAAPCEDFSQLIVYKSRKNPSVGSEDEDQNLTGDNLQDSSVQPPEGQYEEGRLQELDSAGLISDDDSADDSMKTRTVSTDLEEQQDEEEEAAASPYDRPHTVRLDMGDGDIVTGYKE